MLSVLPLKLGDAACSAAAPDSPAAGTRGDSKLPATDPTPDEEPEVLTGALPLRRLPIRPLTEHTVSRREPGDSERRAADLISNGKPEEFTRAPSPGRLKTRISM